MCARSRVVIIIMAILIFWNVWLKNTYIGVRFQFKDLYVTAYMYLRVPNMFPMHLKIAGKLQPSPICCSSEVFVKKTPSTSGNE